MLFTSLLSGLAFGSLAFAGVVPREPPTPVLVERQVASTTPVPDGQCTHGPQQRFCWTQGYSISTDFDAKVAPEGVEVKYNLEITNTTMPNPDGSGGLRQVMLINGQYPGPTLRGKWGDTFIVTVKNSLQHNGTGIHWHGIRQLNSCQNDGVPGVSECPIAPGKTRTYRFRATQFGTTWYHSHWSIQYGDGVVGALVIDGPAVSNYDEDLGPLPLTDWYYTPAFTLNEITQAQGFPPPAQNILVNGTHVNPNGGGQYAKITVKKGKKYRLRLINMSVDSYFSVSMDGHPFTVITSDFVPIRPYVTDQLTLAIGQRYDVIISANQTDDKNYWFRVSTGCANNDINNSKIQLGAILQYESGPSGNPTSTTNVTMRTTCSDETNLIPFVPNQVPNSLVGSAKELDLNSFRDPNAHNHFRWTIDGSPMIVDFNDPTLETVLAKSENFYNNSNVVSIQDSDWTLWWIQTNPVATNPKLAHPIHLHGHDFYIVGKGSGIWDGSTTGLNFDNPTRRDTATLPAGPPGGYLLIAFPADNPGMWIIHCHIAWHASQGLSFQFGERYSDIRAGSLGDTGDLKKGCDEWDKYWYPGTRPDKPYNQTDSGI